MKKHNSPAFPIWFAAKGGNHARGPFRVYAWRPASPGEQRVLSVQSVLVVVRDAWTTESEAKQAAGRLNQLDDQRLALREASPCYSQKEAEIMAGWRGTVGGAWDELGVAFADTWRLCRATRTGRWLAGIVSYFTN